MLVVHAGNRTDAPGTTVARFPECRVAAVSAQVGRLLDTLRPALVVSAAAAGADLIVLEAAQRAGVPVHVLLPLPEAEFEGRSVADRGSQWVERFRTVLHAARRDARSTVDERDASPAPRWWRAANDELVALALRHAAPRLPLALTIRPVGGERPPSGTDHFASVAAAAGLVIATIDPRPGAPAGQELVVG